MGQVDSNLVLKFHFDDFETSESEPGVKKIGVSPSNDRFGNKNSAMYFQGNAQSYINLGTSSKLKPVNGSISLWFRLDEVVFSGQGYTHNVILLTKSHLGDDFFEGYMIDYDYQGKRIIGAVTQNSVNQLSIRSTDTLITGKWYHTVITFDQQYLRLYVDGVLQNKLVKKFPNRYLETDSVMLGNSANLKNLRFFNGAIDDVEIYHRVLSEKEISDLYTAPNPNRSAVFWQWFTGVVALLAFVFGIVLLVKARIRTVLKKEKEKNQLELHALEQEIKMMKAQMDPHFIFNSLNTILHFIVTKENEKAEVYLTKFSKLVRKLLESNTSEAISLKDELYILQKYLEIESLRFNKVITTSLEVEQGIDPEVTFIPHMMIQPFVENAIWHGLRSKEEDRQLLLKFEKRNDRTLFCVVEDNGIGRSTLAKAKEGEGRSLAINFTRQRLDLMNRKYKSDYQLVIHDKVNERNENIGTRIELTLPIIYK